jgi:hypothetical protein
MAKADRLQVATAMIRQAAGGKDLGSHDMQTSCAVCAIRPLPARLNSNRQRQTIRRNFVLHIRSF